MQYLSGIQFENPQVLALLAIVGLLAIYWLGSVIFKWIKRPPKTRGSTYPLIGRSALWLFVCGAIAWSVVALARPYREQAGAKQVRGCLELMTLVDVSVSMLADDVGATRVERVSESLLDLASSGLLREGCDHLAFTAFGAIPNNQQLHSDDFNLYRSLVANMSIKEGIVSGDELVMETDITSVLDDVVRTLDLWDDFFKKEYGESYESIDLPVTVILFSDGDDNALAGESYEILEGVLAELSRRNIKVYTVGVGGYGSQSIADIIHRPDIWDSLSNYRKNMLERDQVLMNSETSLQTEVLRMVAQRTGGEFIALDAPEKSVDAFLRSAVRDNRPLIAQTQTVKDGNREELWPDALKLALLFIVLPFVISMSVNIFRAVFRR